jgi:hypothetical protein
VTEFAVKQAEEQRTHEEKIKRDKLEKKLKRIEDARIGSRTHKKVRKGPSL